MSLFFHNIYCIWPVIFAFSPGCIQFINHALISSSLNHRYYTYISVWYLEKNLLKGRRDFAAEPTWFLHWERKNKQTNFLKRIWHIFFGQNKNNTFGAFYISYNGFFLLSVTFWRKFFTVFFWSQRRKDNDFQSSQVSWYWQR